MYSGTTSLQMSLAYGQRVWKRHPEGGLAGEGMYTQVNKKVLLTVADRRQIPKIKQISKKYDKKSFIIVTDVREALGEGFKKQ